LHPRLKYILNLLLGISLLAAICWFFFFLVQTIIRGLATIESQVSVAIVAASGAAMLSVVSLIVTKHLESRNAILQELRAKKVPVYEHLIRIMFTVVFAEKRGEKPPTEQELIKEFASFTEKILVWGSDDVIRAYSRFRGGSSGDPIALIRIQEDLFLAIRKDLGHKNKNLPRGTILGLFVNDLDVSKLQ
jgi:hypothetical protein